jgi:PAS domain S-box-containing protein
MKKAAFENKIALTAELFKHSELSVIITDKPGHVLWVNNAFEQNSGFFLQDILGEKPGFFLQGKETPAESITFFSEKLKEVVTFTVEILNYTKAGEKVWVSIFVSPIFDNDEHVGFLSILRKENIMRQN